MFFMKLMLCALLFYHPSIHESSLLNSPDVFIDAGHGGLDGGTAMGNLLEKNINLQMGMLLYEHLSALGLHVVLDRMGDYALSDENQWLNIHSRHKRDLAQRKEIANQLHPRLLISLHANWSANKRVSGPLVLYQKNPDSLLLAQLLLKHMNPLFTSERAPNPPIYGKKFYLLNHSKVPSVILEMGYISNAADCKRLTEQTGQTQLIKAISDAVQEYLAQHKQSIANPART